MPKRLGALMLLLAMLCFAGSAAFGKSTPRDRDHDRLPDKWEKRYDLSAQHRSTNRDPDHDGLTNLREYKRHTNTRRADTDRDGLNDGAEVKRYKTNPRRADTDNDGLKDGAEVKRYKTNPRRADTDRDGFKDGAEVKAGTNPRNAASHPTPPPGPNAGRGSCASGTPNVRDGKDPWGGCFPGPLNTGTPPGTVLTDYTGSCRITVANTVIDKQTINCRPMNIFAQNVVIKNSKVNGGIWVDSPDQGGSFTVMDTTIDAGAVDQTTNDGPRAVCCANFTALRIQALRGISGGFCEYYCEVRDSFICCQDRDEGGHAHESGMRLGSGTLPNSQRLIHNTIRCDGDDVPPDAGCSADITGYGDFNFIRNNLVENNLLEWSPTGGYCAYGGSTGGKPYPTGSNNTFRDNVFQRGPNGKCGVYGAITDLEAGMRGNTWTNNRWDTGELMAAG